MRRIVYPALIAAMCGVVVSSLSLAETVSIGSELKNNKRTADYISSRPMMESLYRIGLMQDKKFGLQTACKEQFMVQPVSTIILSEIDYPDDKPYQEKGTWISRYQFERCGETKVYNALFMANGDGKAPTAHIYYPGYTNAEPRLIKDAFPLTASHMLILAGLKGCNDVNIFDMRITEQPHDVEEGGKTFKSVWNEVWTFRACGKTADVAMTFIPDADGGGATFNAGAVKLLDDTAKP
ncbi:hypothetical protein OL229_20885 [Neisseriaceae bacterium JH1-16]|nr:hypothetical protein [Neisseriaceae bacterium JH1-16]